MDNLKEKGAEWLVNSIYSILQKKHNFIPENISIKNFGEKKFCTYKKDNNDQEKGDDKDNINQENWDYVALFVIKYFLEKWEKENCNILNYKVSTLCTMQDDFDNFNKIGILDPEKLFNERITDSYETIYFERNNTSIIVEEVSRSKIIQQIRFYFFAFIENESSGWTIAMLVVLFGLFFLNSVSFREFFFHLIHRLF